MNIKWLWQKYWKVLSILGIDPLYSLDTSLPTIITYNLVSVSYLFLTLESSENLHGLHYVKFLTIPNLPSWLPRTFSYTRLYYWTELYTNRSTLVDMCDGHSPLLPRSVKTCDYRVSTYTSKHVKSIRIYLYILQCYISTESLSWLFSYRNTFKILNDVNINNSIHSDDNNIT